MSAADFGPWRPDIPEHERVAGLRVLRALALVILGARHPLVAALRDAEGSPKCSSDAQQMLDALPALKMRKILRSYLALSKKGKSS